MRIHLSQSNTLLRVLPTSHEYEQCSQQTDHAHLVDLFTLPAEIMQILYPFPFLVNFSQLRIS